MEQPTQKIFRDNTLRNAYRIEGLSIQSLQEEFICHYGIPLPAKASDITGIMHIPIAPEHMRTSSTIMKMREHQSKHSNTYVQEKVVEDFSSSKTDILIYRQEFPLDNLTRHLKLHQVILFLSKELTENISPFIQEHEPKLIYGIISKLALNLHTDDFGILISGTYSAIPNIFHIHVFYPEGAIPESIDDRILSLMSSYNIPNQHYTHRNQLIDALKRTLNYYTTISHLDSTHFVHV